MAVLLAGFNSPTFEAPPVPPVFTATLAWACLGLGFELAGATDEAADAEAIAHGLSGVAFCLAAALLLRSAHVAWSIQRVLAAEAKPKELM